MIKILVISFFLLLLGGAYLHHKFPIFVQYQNKDTVEVVEDIIYQEGSTDPKHQLDIYLPKGVENFPVVHFVHGGYWTSGDKNYFAFGTGLYKNIGQSLAKNGIGVVIQNYRLADGTTQITEQTQDIVAGVRWTKNNLKNYGGDVDQIFLMGHSAGGHLISLVGTDPRYFETNTQDSVSLAGIIALSPLWDIQALERISKPDFNQNVTYQVFGSDASKYSEFSPVTYLQQPIPRMLVVLAEQDYPFIKQHVPDIIKTLATPPPLVIIPNFDHITLVTNFGTNHDQMTPLVKNFIFPNK